MLVTRFKRSNTLQLDVLDTFETIKIAIAYKIDGEVSDANGIVGDCGDANRLDRNWTLTLRILTSSTVLRWFTTRCQAGKRRLPTRRPTMISPWRPAIMSR